MSGAGHAGRAGHPAPAAATPLLSRSAPGSPQRLGWRSATRAGAAFHAALRVEMHDGRGARPPEPGVAAPGCAQRTPGGVRWSTWTAFSEELGCIPRRTDRRPCGREDWRLSGVDPRQSGDLLPRPLAHLLKTHRTLPGKTFSLRGKATNHMKVLKA